MALLRRLVIITPRYVRPYASAPPARDELDVSFNNPIDAFKSKKTSELIRAYLVYQICSVNFLVENNDMVSRTMQAILRNTETPIKTMRRCRNGSKIMSLSLLLAGKLNDGSLRMVILLLTCM